MENGKCKKENSKMEIGKWIMGNGKNANGKMENWKMWKGKWEMGKRNEKWKVENIKREMESGKCRKENG